MVSFGRAQQGSKAATKVHSAIWGMSLLAGSVFATIVAAPAAIADRGTSTRNHYLVFFTPESTDITPAADVIVKKAVSDADANARIVVKGYAAEGEEGGPELAAERAKRVAQAFKTRGAATPEVRAEMVSVAMTPAPELTSDMNRRVEILVEPRGPSYSQVSEPSSSVIR